MTTQDIARYLNERLHRASPVVMPGEVTNAIGAYGLQEALNRRWLVADTETGFLQVNNDAGRMAEIEAAANQPAMAESVAESASAGLVMAHAERGLTETGAPGTGKPGPGYTPTAPAAPAPSLPAAPTAGRPRSAGVGDDVTVAEDGRTYAGKVQSRDPVTGQVRITFGPDQRPTTDRAYRDEEIQLTGQP